MLLARDVDNSNLFLFSGAYSLSQQDKQGKLWFPAGWTITLKRFDSLSLVTHISHSADVWEQTREELGNLSSFTSNVMLLFAVSAGRELTALNWSTTQGDLSALFTVIKTGISNAVLDFLTLRGLGMLGLAQQWWDSSCWSPGLLQKWCSRGAVLRMGPNVQTGAGRHSLNVQCIHQSCWGSLILECKISISTWKICKEVSSLTELFRRGCCLSGRADFFLVFLFPVLWLFFS